MTAQGIEARSAETLGSARRARARPEGMRPDSVVTKLPDRTHFDGWQEALPAPQSPRINESNHPSRILSGFTGGDRAAS